MCLFHAATTTPASLGAVPPAAVAKQTRHGNRCPRSRSCHVNAAVRTAAVLPNAVARRTRRWGSSTSRLFPSRDQTDEAFVGRERERERGIKEAARRRTAIRTRRLRSVRAEAEGLRATRARRRECAWIDSDAYRRDGGECGGAGRAGAKGGGQRRVGRRQTVECSSARNARGGGRDGIANRDTSIGDDGSPFEGASRGMRADETKVHETPIEIWPRGILPTLLLRSYFQGREEGALREGGMRLPITAQAVK